MTPYLQDPDVILYNGDALETLRQLPDRSVHMCCTSPPFYGLRDYGMEGQIGLEESPDVWVARLVEVFREVRRVLRDDGTLWVEIGDSYAGSWGNQGRKAERGTQRPINGGMLTPVLDGRYPDPGSNTGKIPEGASYKPKDLLGQPWLLAFALRADGWFLRSEIIWARPNPMPESVTDRPTKAHSTVFLLSKKPRYYYDAEAIREPHAQPGRVQRNASLGYTANGGEKRDAGVRVTAPAETSPGYHPAGANARSVWNIATEPTPFAHFATWPQALCRRMILAGTSERGVCPECGGPWVREVEAQNGYPASVRPITFAPDFGVDLRAAREAVGMKQSDLSQHFPSRTGGLTGIVSNWETGKMLPPPTDAAVVLSLLPSLSPKYDGLVLEASDAGEGWAEPDPFVNAKRGPSLTRSTSTRDWRPSCDHDAEPVPATILDPFGGSGTTALVARKLGRKCILVELNPDYCVLTSDRLRQQSLFAQEIPA